MNYVAAFILRLAAEAVYRKWRGGWGERFCHVSYTLDSAAAELEAS